MNDYLRSVILGIVEGLTEFLPVSSTAHLRICEGLLRIDLRDEYWKMYTVVIQLGAILSVVAYFSRRIWNFTRTFPRGQRGELNALTHPLSLTAIAFVLTAIPSLLLEDVIGENLESLYVMSAALLAGGAIMWIVDSVYTNPLVDDMERMGIWRAMWIGLFQTLAAIFPGTSRSMVTIAAGQVTGMSRSAALEFSFFLSIPTMIAATGFKLVDYIKGDHAALATASIRMDAHGWTVLAIGFVVSFVVALAVVAWFMHWVRRHGFVPFAIYRIALGIGILLWAWRSGHTS